MLVLTARNLSNELESYVMDFNRTNSRYPITVELEKSPILDKEDFLENVLEGYTIDDRLVCLPDSFTCQTVLGRLAQVEEKTGWTARDVMTFAEDYPDAQLFRNPTFTSMLSFFGNYILERYINWESGECSFDGEEFRELVRWMETHSEGFGNGMADSTYDSIAGVDTPIAEEELLILEACIFDLSSMVRYGMWIGEDVSAVGYPTVDGSVSYAVYADNAVGIVAASKEKEAAWEFLEGLLDKIAEELVTPEYEHDEKGEVIV